MSSETLRLKEKFKRDLASIINRRKRKFNEHDFVNERKSHDIDYGAVHTREFNNDYSTTDQFLDDESFSENYEFEQPLKKKAMATSTPFHQKISENNLQTTENNVQNIKKPKRKYVNLVQKVLRESYNNLSSPQRIQSHGDDILTDDNTTNFSSRQHTPNQQRQLVEPIDRLRDYEMTEDEDESLTYAQPPSFGPPQLAYNQQLQKQVQNSLINRKKGNILPIMPSTSRQFEQPIVTNAPLLALEAPSTLNLPQQQQQHSFKGKAKTKKGRRDWKTVQQFSPKLLRKRDRKPNYRT